MRRNRWIPLLSASLIAIAIAGCSRVRVVTHSDPHWHHPGLQTYLWKPDPPPLGEPRLDEKSLAPAIRRSADAALAEKGYKLVSSEPVDFKMAYRLGLGQADREFNGSDSDTSDLPGWLQFWENAGKYEPARNERALVIYSVDPVAHKLGWQGVGYVLVDFKASTATHRERVTGVVEKILEEFPRAE